MTETSPTLDRVRQHYSPHGLVDRLREALRVFGPDETSLSPVQLAPLDHFHTRGAAATSELIALAGIAPSQRVLDLGSGVGGPARFVAARTGCPVQGLDLSPEFTAAARYLTERTGQSAQVSFETGGATRTPFADAAFDQVLLLHVAMNIADRDALYAEVHRLLSPGGRFTTFDVVRAAGDPEYPTPWAAGRETSFLLTADETLKAVESAGLRTLAARDESAPAVEFFRAMSSAPPSDLPGLGLIMGPQFRTAAGNLGRSLEAGAVGVFAAHFQRR